MYRGNYGADEGLLVESYKSSVVVVWAETALKRARQEGQTSERFVHVD